MTIQDRDTIQVGDDVKVILGNVRMIMPALDCNPDETLLLTVPMPGIRTTYDKKGNPEQKGEMVLCTITSKPEIFETSNHEFMKRGWLAQIPNPILEQRWDAASIESFLDGEVSRVDPWHVYQEIRSKFDHYVDFDNATYGPTVCAVYTAASYFYFLFEYFPYLKFGGEKGSGKTKTGTIFAALAFNGQIFANASRAVIYRTAQDTRGTMVIDEGESLAYKSEEQATYMQVLNSGWQRNGYAILSDKETLRPTKWSTYCPKVVCSIGGLEDVLGDRAFEIILLRTFNREKANLEVSLASKEWQPLRDMEYLFLLQHWKEVVELIPTVTNTFEFAGRIWNLAKPLIAVARFLDGHRPEGASSVEAEVRAFIQAQAKEKVVKASEGFGSAVLTALREVVHATMKGGTLDAAQDPYVRVELNELTEKIREAEAFEKLSPKTVARTLVNLSLYNEVRRDGKHGERRFGVRPSQLNQAEARLLGGAKATDGTTGTDAPDDGKDSPAGQSASDGGSVSSSGSAEMTVPSGADGDIVSGSPSESSVETGICAVCGKDGGRARLSGDKGVVYLHQDCEKDWEGKL